MLTQNEITALSLSPTKKDFVQIWNELLEVAGKLSERWDPTSTNESDPGIVILKALTGIADKLNYNIDKNILEAFMPTAAQEDSMRKLCDMLGYNMKYYRSAEVDVKIKYHNSDPSDEEAAAMAAPGQLIPKFTVITNSDKDISYFILDSEQDNKYISSDGAALTVHCMEGQVVKCESNSDNNIITANQVKENNRFYLPETQIAENGIFIYNVTNTAGGNLADGEKWTKVDNLNTQSRDSRVFKFGFDSYESRPYVEFPEGYSKLFNEGIFLYYTRTSGVNGNISPKTLTQLELPTTGNWSDVSADSISVENVFSATTGANAETIRQAYNNFKKTIGTFETLVTCRDYMNKIYSYLVNGKPVVSNILVTDIRNDLNRAIQICSCDGSGIFYKDTPVFKTVTRTLKKSGSNEVVDVEDTESLINNFDIILYPFKSYSQVKSNIKSIREVYDSSFNYAKDAYATITQKLGAEEIQTISHNFKSPDVGDVISINNYLRLNATVATNHKVTTDEGSIIVDNIKMALANAFNMRELDFGDEIPFDSIVEVIENADTRIKVASLNEPAMYTTFSVLEENIDGIPTITEYAVASEWLDIENAEKTGRFTKVVDEKGSTISTFDTEEARKIYNKLAVRNLLAGRVPLFNYNNTFKASFSEGVYQVTTEINESEKPAGLAKPEDTNPYTIWKTGNTIYTGQLDQDGKPVYSKTAPVYADNIITEEKNEDTGDIANYITGISTDCKILANDASLITDVTLDSGEFVKFRAPNFTTIKTYPAYVNYHLALTGGEAASAYPAVAESLFNILNSDLNNWSVDKPNIKWQKALDYFSTTTDTGTLKDSYKKKFTIKQLVRAHQVADNDFSLEAGDLETTISVGLNNTPVEETEYTAESLFALSGCVKLTNKNFTARVEWTPQDAEKVPDTTPDKVPLNIVLGDFTNPFITDISVLSQLKSQLDTALSTYKNSLPIECTKCSFTVYLDFECVPFEAKSLRAWESFIEECSKELDNDEFEYQVLDYTPNKGDANDTVFWRLFGDGYDIGKYVTQNTEKLLKFDISYFGLLPSTPLMGIYLVSNPGADMLPVIIKNNEEYKLRSGERLYIEYTPSTTTEDGGTTNNSAVTEVYGEGTIIRPSGFETGLLDSTVYAKSVTPHKNTAFLDAGVRVEKPMHRFGAKEQVEIRDFSKVTLSSDTLPAIYMYKNFNDCPALENAPTSDGATRKYTLKDGEAIFYTDQNQSEFAYFTSGTEVILEGSVKIAKFDIIELSTIFETGPQAIPWKRIELKDANSDSITFQEYQYITLGNGDTINSMLVLDANSEKKATGEKVPYLSSDWKFCSDVEYTLASDPETKLVLPTINLHSDRAGNGWEASSTLELDVSSNVAQTLRNTDKVKTSLELSRTKTTGGPAKSTVISAQSGSAESYEQPMLFKTNLACVACGSEIAIDKVLSNPDKLKGFQLKVFTNDEPTIVQTKPGKVIPHGFSGTLTSWTGDPSAIKKEYLDSWSQVNLKEICINSGEGDDRFDNALRLAVSLLPNTYGVFCVYLDYKNADTAKVATWIEVIPGTDSADISLLNVKNSTADYLDADGRNLHRLYLNPGINCIRVNKSDRIFIKTAANSDGVLYFDELQLVNSLPIKYTDADNTTITTNTNGLNIAQLGYLPISDSDAISPVVKEKLQEGYVNEMYSGISNRISEAETEFTDSYKELLELLPELRELINKEELVEADIIAISKLDAARLSDLIAQYKKLKETLAKENALLKAFNNNTVTDELEQSLVTLLDSFTVTDTAKQQIFDEFEVLRTEAEARLKKLSDKLVLEDFNAVLDEYKKDYEKVRQEICDSNGLTVEQLEKEHTTQVISALNQLLKADIKHEELLSAAFDKVKPLIEESIENHYQERLAAISESLDKIVNSTGKSTLQTILTNLKTVATKDAHDELLAKIAELRSVVETDVSGILESMVEAAYANPPDYIRLLSLLTQLRNTVDSTTISTLVEEIAQAAEESNYKQVVVLLEAFSKRIPDIDSTSSAITDPGKLNDSDSLLKYINDVYNIVKNASSSGEAAASIDTTRSAVDKLKNKVLKDYTTNINNILAIVQLDDNSETTTLLEKLFASTDSIDSILVELTNTEFKNDDASSQIQLIIEQLKKAIDDRNTFIKGNKDKHNGLIDFESFENWKSNTCKEFIEAAILTVWPELISERATAVLDGVYDCFANALLIGLKTFGEYEDSLSDTINKETNTLQLMISSHTIYYLFDKVRPILNADDQIYADSERIKEINSLIRDSDDLSAALADITDSTPTANVVLKSLLNEYLDHNRYNDVKRKHELQETIKDALGNAISVNEQLFNVVARMLCPNITKLLAELDPENAFYKKFINKLNELEAAIIRNDNTADIDVEYDRVYLTLLNKSFEDFKAGLVTFEFVENTLVPDSIVNVLKAMYDTLSASTELIACVEELRLLPLAKLSSIDIDGISIVNSTAAQYLVTLRDKVEKLERTTTVEPEYEEAFKTLDLEQQLLDEIRAIDINRDFYYNAPSIDSRAIELNESVSSHNTLMNPHTNYDINNINNSFVISKLDIDFLDSGIKIARSSRLN